MFNVGHETYTRAIVIASFGSSAFHFTLQFIFANFLQLHRGGGGGHLSRWSPLTVIIDGDLLVWSIVRRLAAQWHRDDDLTMNFDLIYVPINLLPNRSQPLSLNSEFQINLFATFFRKNKFNYIQGYCAYKPRCYTVHATFRGLAHRKHGSIA